MLRRLLVVCLLLCTPQLRVLADGSIDTVRVHYWVLGSYAKADNAHAEMERLSEELGKTVEIRFDDRLAVFRVLTLASETNREDLGEQAAWLLPLEIPASEVSVGGTAPQEVPQGIGAGVLDDAPIIIEEPEIEPLYPEFTEHETLHEYCERLPAAKLCQHPRIESAVEKDRLLAEQREKLQGVCDEITHPDWLETCQSLYPED